MKVCVYGIAKNESKFVDEWVDSMSEADEIYVLVDGTTTDDTAEKLRARGVHVEVREIKPFRFDVARNASLELVPDDCDVCVCTDLDERFSPGWREVLEREWVVGVNNQAEYKFWHNAGSAEWDEPNIFTYSKIHSRRDFHWKWAVHEYIVANEGVVVKKVELPGVMLKHYPDGTKSRSSYTPLLELAVKDDPKDTRCLELLCEAYLSEKRVSDAEKILEKLFDRKSKDPLGGVGMCFKLKVMIAKAKRDYDGLVSGCYEALSRKKLLECRWFYGELGEYYVCNGQEVLLGLGMLAKCLNIENDVISSREVEWKDKAKIYSIMSIGWYKISKFDESVKYAKMAVEVNKKPWMREALEENLRRCEAVA